MTIRQRFATFTLAGALCCGLALAVDASSASAAPWTSRVAPGAFDQVATTAAAALDAMGTDTFGVRLAEAASAVATRLEVDPLTLRDAWVAANRPHQIATLSALSQVGVAYHRNSSKPGVAFDCSGLTAFAWDQAGVTLAHQSGRQIRSVEARTHETAEAGDLVYYPGHVMMWLGVGNLIVHAADPVRDVEVTDMSDRRVNRSKFGDPAG